jgi:hypothetical protein
VTSSHTDNQYEKYVGVNMSLSLALKCEHHCKVTQQVLWGMESLQ